MRETYPHDGGEPVRWSPPLASEQVAALQPTTGAPLITSNEMPDDGFFGDVDPANSFADTPVIGGEADILIPAAERPSGYERERIDQLRRQVIEQVGHLHDPSGIRTEQIAHFYRALGMVPAGDALVIDRKYAPELGRALEQVDEKLSDESIGGAYHTNLGLTVVFRDPSWNPATVENYYQHEQGHATQGVYAPEITLANVRNAFTDRLRPLHRRVFMMRGFKIRGNGSWLEEGVAKWCELQAQATIGRHPDAPQPTVNPHRPGYLPDWLRQMPSRPADEHYMYAALGLDVLFAKNPKLLDTVTEVRSRPELMPLVRKEMNSMHPHLYKTLLAIPLEPMPSDGDRFWSAHQKNVEAFKNGLGIVLAATGYRWEDLPSLSGPDSPAWQQAQTKMRDYEQTTGFRFK